MQLKNRKTGEIRDSKSGPWTLADGRPVSGDLMGVPLSDRLAMGWYELRTVEGDTAGEEWDDATGACTRTVAPVVAETVTIPPKVIEAAMELLKVVTWVAHTYGLLLDTSSGYTETDTAIFESGLIPPEEQSRVWVKLDTRYRDLDHHIQKWQSGAVTWDMLPQIKATLETIGE